MHMLILLGDIQWGRMYLQSMFIVSVSSGMELITAECSEEVNTISCLHWPTLTF